MTRRAKIGWSIFALLVLVAAVAAFVIRGDRPSVNALFDQTYLLLTGEDPVSRCWSRKRVNGSEIKGFIGARGCYAFAPARLFDGVVVDEFEGRRFIPHNWVVSRPFRAPSIALEMDRQSDLRVQPRLGTPRDGLSRVWRVRFIGRQPNRPGRYGHMGMSSQMVLVDQLLSAELLTTYDGYLPESLDPRTINSDNRR